MNYQWAEGQLREYVQAVRDCGALQVLTKERRAAVKALSQRLPQVNYILANLTPDHQHVSGTNLNWHEGNIPVLAAVPAREHHRSPHRRQYWVQLAARIGRLFADT